MMVFLKRTLDEAWTVQYILLGETSSSFDVNRILSMTAPSTNK